MENRLKKLTKSLIVIASYFIYSYIGVTLLKSIPVLNKLDDYTINFIVDIIYMVIIVILYLQEVRDDFHKLSNNFGKNLLTVIKWLLISLGLQILATMILYNWYPDINNTSTVDSLPTIYRVFKVLFFSVIVEEIVYKKTIYDVVKNPYLFTVLSSLFFAFMNVVYTDLNTLEALATMIPIFVSSCALCTLYVKTDNITSPMLAKFIYNFINLAMLLIF